MGIAAAWRGGRARRGIAWLALLALLLNAAFPALAIRALPPADLLAGVLCHAAPQDGQDRQDQKAPHQGACPVCALMAAPAMPVLPAAVAALPLPGATGSIVPRGPPALAALPAETRPPAARAPPFPV